MNIGRRPLFFFGISLLCLLLVPLTPAEFRWLNLAMFCLALFWTIALSVEELSTLRSAGGRRRGS
jgi:hypothetical protein